MCVRVRVGVGVWGVCVCVRVCGSGMFICFVSALGSHEMGRHTLPIIVIIVSEYYSLFLHDNVNTPISRN